MEKRILRIEILLVIILVIVTTNLLLPYINGLDFLKSSENDTALKKELPADLTRDRLNDVAYQLKMNFNKSDWSAMYDVFGEYAKAQISIENVKNEFVKLRSATGKIQTYAYSHYIYEGYGDNADWFEFQYKCRFENGIGTIKISTRTIDDESDITGINIILDEL